MTRIAIGCFLQESHSFSPVPGSWRQFGPQELLRGEDVFSRFRGTQTEIGGALDCAGEHGFETVPLLSARPACSSGPIRRDVFEDILDELVRLLDGAGYVDGVLLVLHGATIAEGHEDACGDVLYTFRQRVGAELPLVVTLDLHANLTRKMVAQATALVGYHTVPHVDLRETGYRGMKLLARMLNDGIRPVTAARFLPMILPGEEARTTDGPLSEVVNQAKALLANPKIVEASVFHVQPWLDVKEVGCAVLVISDSDVELAEKEAERLADEFWRRRSRFAVNLTSIDDAVAAGLANPRHPVILADPADAPSSGAPGDSPAILRALLKMVPEKDCHVNIVDEEAVHRMVGAGVGEEVTVELGGKLAPAFYSPVTVRGRVWLLSDGTYVQKAAGSAGMTIYRGVTGVLEVGHIKVVVMERPVMQWDPELYRSVGLEPKEAQIVVVKSPAAFRAAYEPFAAEVLLVDSPGVASSKLTEYPFTHIGRPLFPFDDIQDWRAIPPGRRRSDVGDGRWQSFG